MERWKTPRSPPSTNIPVKVIESCGDAEKETRGGSSARAGSRRFSGVVGGERAEIGLELISTPTPTHLPQSNAKSPSTHSLSSHILDPLFFLLSPSLYHLYYFHCRQTTLANYSTARPTDKRPSLTNSPPALCPSVIHRRTLPIG